MILTLHACLRYMERIRPGADKREANIVLADAALRARHEGRRTRTGESELAGLDEAEAERRVQTIVAKVEELRVATVKSSSGPWNTWPISKTIGKRGRRMVDERLLAMKTARERGR